MIEIKVVDGQNLLDICELKTNQDNIHTAIEIDGQSNCNAFFIAESKHHSEMYQNAIYNNNVLIGFFMYRRTENHADTAIIYRFMIDCRFQHKGLEEKAFEHIIRGLKIQGVKKIMLMIEICMYKALLLKFLKKIYLRTREFVTELHLKKYKTLL